MRTVALILAGGAGTRLDVLAEHRAKPAVPFGGKYRIIDFTLSNCANSGIRNLAVLTQHFPRSLSQHIGIGRPWDFDRKFGGIAILAPYHGRAGEWYSGTAQAVFQNLDFLAERDADTVLVLCGDHVYQMDYRPMLRAHAACKSDVTIAASPVDEASAPNFGILSMNEQRRIVEFEEKPAHPRSRWASMGIYAFRISVLREVLEDVCQEQKNADFGKDVIPRILARRVYAYPFTDYWRDVGTLEEYWKANMDLTLESPPLDLFRNSNHNVYTRNWELPPVKFGPKGTAHQSLISGGCVIHGTVENSVLSSHVIVEEGAVVRNSIIFDRTTIRSGTVVDRSILDKDVVVGESCRIGFGSSMVKNEEVPQIVYSGLNVVGKSVRIPHGTTIERNCRILSGVIETDFCSRTITSGATVFPARGRHRVSTSS